MSPVSEGEEPSMIKGGMKGTFSFRTFFAPLPPFSKEGSRSNIPWPSFNQESREYW